MKKNKNMRNVLDSQEKYLKSSQLWPKRIMWLIMGALIGAGVMLSLLITLQEETTFEQGTQALRMAGIEHIEVRKGLWGPALYDPRMEVQKGRCFDSVEDAVQAALAGERPSKMEVVENKN